MNRIQEETDKAKAYSNELKFEEAIEILENLIFKNPKSDNIKELLIKTLLDYGGHLNDEFSSDYNRAIKILNKIIEIEPNNYRAYYNLGITYQNLNEYDCALKNLNKALTIKPDYKYCYYNIGLIYEDMKELQKALDSYENALKIDKNFSYALHAKHILRRILDDL
ncbi:MAG: tetratricopeptide repeat protein [Candidatus Lokiarchaeota archaeon]|nr:tetratricopeptide repeat protein [Candidatus Lokiarchaeota archaeon]